MASSAAYSRLVLLLIMTVAFALGWSSSIMIKFKSPEAEEVHNDGSDDGFFTYKDWINSEKEIDVYNDDVGLSYGDCLRIGFAGLWPALGDRLKHMTMSTCRDLRSVLTYSWRGSGAPYPPRIFIAALIDIGPSFWKDHKEIYNRIVHSSYIFYDYYHRRSKEEVDEAVGDFSSYETWIDSEKKIKFDDGRNMTYEKCVKMEFGRVWDKKDKAQRESRDKCDSMAQEVFDSWVRSGKEWPPEEFFGALMKVPSFWRDRTQIYKYIIRPAQFYNLPDGQRRLPLVLGT